MKPKREVWVCETKAGRVRWSPFTGHPMIYETKEEAETDAFEADSVVRYVPAPKKRKRRRKSS